MRVSAAIFSLVMVLCIASAAPAQACDKLPSWASEPGSSGHSAPSTYREMCEYDKAAQERLDANMAAANGCPQKILHGTIVAALGPAKHGREQWTAYEVSLSDRLWERNENGPPEHVILVAKKPFGAPGQFMRCVRSETTTRDIPLANGFSKAIEVFEEQPPGTK